MTYSRDRGYDVDETFFEAPFTEESAYILGFWAGDGWVYKSSLAVTLAEKDKKHIETIRRLMHSQHPIELREREAGSYYRLRIGSRLLVDRLAELGIKPRKSLTYNPKDTLEHLPSTHHRHFFRGLIDADGHVCAKRNRISLVGSKHTCKEFRRFLLRNDIQTKAQVRDTVSQIYTFSASGVFLAAKVGELLYDDSCVALTRKQNQALEIIDNAAQRS